MLKWKITKEEKLLTTQLFDVFKQNVIGPQNYQKDYIVVKRKPTVSVIPLTEDNHIYLVGQERYLLGKFAWELMAGYVEEGEDPLTTAKRELKEETGIVAKSWKKLAQLQMSATGIRAVSHLFLARDLQLSSSDPQEGEFLTVKKVSLPLALDYVLKGKITNSVSMAGILLVDKLIRLKKI